MRNPQRRRAIWAVACSGVFALAAAGNKPQPGPGPQPAPAPAERKPSAKEEAEAAAHKAYSDKVEARTKADLMRAAFEKKYKAGTLPEGAVKEFNEVVAAYRAAIELPGGGEIAAYCRQSLAGVYMYVGDFAATTRIMQEAVNSAKGPAGQVQACHGMALHQLQALKKPEEARRWLARAAASLERIEEPNERAKWAVAIEELMARCEEKK